MWFVTNQIYSMILKKFLLTLIQKDLTNLESIKVKDDIFVFVFRLL